MSAEFGLGRHIWKLCTRIRQLSWRRKFSRFDAISTSPAPPIPGFGDDEEALFWQERRAETIKPLIIALFLGAGGFFGFVVLDLASQGLSWFALFGRLLPIVALLALACVLRVHKKSVNQIALIANSGAIISAIDLLGTLLIEDNPSVFREVWPGLIPIYFVTYGQLVMPLTTTLLFGGVTLVATPLIGSTVGVDQEELWSAGIMLLIVNLFGLFTRCQLESYSRRLFKARRLAECAAEDKAEFMRQSSHNLRQPLQALSCYSTVLIGAIAREQLLQAGRTADQLGIAIDELNDSFNRILDIANLESGKQIPQVANVEINRLFEVLENQFAPIAQRAGLRLKVACRHRPPYVVRSDANILRQVLSNLVDNAIKYTRSGHVLIATHLASPTQLEIHVRDTGVGIPEGQSDAIFNEFHRVNRRHNDPRSHGLGIGLAYAKKAIDRLPEHYLSYRDRTHHGTDFYVGLPIELCGITTHSLVALKNDLNGRYVLLVDDDAAVLNALADQLRYWGCIVENASSVMEVRRILAETLRPPDLLITDFYLGPCETAHEVITSVVNDCGYVPTLILSAKSISDVDKRKWSSSTRLLRKPTSATTLFTTIDEMLAQPA